MAVTPVSQGPRAGHLNALLSQLSIEFRPTNGRYVVDEIFPVLPVQFENDSYAKWDKGQRFRVDRTDGRDTLRADGTRAREKKYGWTYDTYLAEEWAEDFYVTDREVNNSDAGLDIVLAHSNGIYDDILRDRELRVAASLTATATYASANTATLSGANQWNSASFASQSTAVFSTIKTNINTGRNAIRTATGGAMPNVVIIPEAVALVMENDVALIDALKHNGAISSLVSDGSFLPHGGMFFGMRILRPSMSYQSEVEGETAVNVDVWGKNLVMAVVGPPAQRTLTFGLQFRKQAFGMMNSWREEATTSTYYRVGMIQAEKIVAAECGYLIHNVIA
jgi:hypothetical protein